MNYYGFIDGEERLKRLRAKDIYFTAHITHPTENRPLTPTESRVLCLMVMQEDLELHGAVLSARATLDESERDASKDRFNEGFEDLVAKLRSLNITQLADAEHLALNANWPEPHYSTQPVIGTMDNGGPVHKIYSSEGVNNDISPELFLIRFNGKNYLPADELLMQLQQISGISHVQQQRLMPETVGNGQKGARCNLR